MKQKGKKRKIEQIPSRSGLEVLFEENWFESSPKCEHGPMLLFERYTDGKKSKSFYACAANRDRKKCRAYVIKEEKQKEYVHRSDPDSKRIEYMNFDVISAVPLSQRIYCFHCRRFLLPNDNTNHINHRIKKNITEEQMLQPSSVFLSALQDTKSDSQFFIKKEATSFLYSSLSALNVTDVVCLGMPRLHEHIQCANLGGDKVLNSVLLDMDERYVTFWPKDKFIRFNLFNHFFFEEEGRTSWGNFLKDCVARNGKLAVVLDPPFGGLVDAIAEGLTWMSGEVKAVAKAQDVVLESSSSLLFFWLFPYFVEPRIKERLPSLHMLDYQVAYDNHAKFKGADSGRYMSPVRIFTNVKNIKLPAESYRLCHLCKRYVHNNNLHCKLCRTCPSKDGRTYVHCRACRKCYKPGRQHCDTCDRCELPDHVCRPKDEVKCFICDEAGHKLRNCPKRAEDNAA